MKHLLYWFLGYTVLGVKYECIRAVLNLINRYHVKVIDMRFSDESARIKIYAREEKKVTSALLSEGVSYTVHCKKGMTEHVKKYRHRSGMIIGAIAMFIALYVSPMFVWEINITGIDRLSEEAVIDILSGEGINLGSFAPLVDRKAVYMNILSKNKDISWIAVNFIGSSANVEIVERDYTTVSEVNSDAANIVASKDGFILETDVICGRRMVDKGDVVKKGDVLVSGIYDTEKMGTRYVYSDADVYAIIYDEFVIKVPLENTKKVYSDETLKACGIKIFGKSINFYKNYSILEGNYDTISREEKIEFLGLETLPISILSTDTLPYTNKHVFLTEDEALERARLEFYRSLDLETDYMEMLSIEEIYTIENSVLIYKPVVEAIQNIAATAEFEIN